MILSQNHWRSSTWLPLGLVLIALGYLYSPFVPSLLEAWDTNDNYSHGYFIPVIALYMIFSKRKVLAQTPLSSGYIGLLLVVAGLVMLIASKVGSEYFLQRFSFVVSSLGLVLFLCGYGYFKVLALPILYLVFMIPLPAIIWNKIAFPMQLFGSYLTEMVIYTIGIPIYREGNVLHLAETTLEVVAACSGLRSLVTMFALSGVFSYFSSLSTPRKWVLFFFAAPIAIFANIVRLTTTAVLASRYGSDVAHGFLHDFSGLLIFILGLVLLIIVNNLLAE